MNSTKQKQLDDLAAKIRDNNICPELAAQATQLVFGDGSPDASIVFIGEAPGKNEDLKGKPFVGAAGKFLDEMLGNIGLERGDIYITNIVKYRPPNNRDPMPEEKAAFLPYLQAQLEIIQPKLVVTLGRHSMNCFLPSVPSCASCKAGGPPEQCSGRVNREHRKGVVAEATTPAEHSDLPFDVRSGGATSEHRGRACDAPLQISKVHGQPKRIKLRFSRSQIVDSRSDNSKDNNYLEIVILPLFHPAAALYNGSMRETLIEDFARIPAVLELIENE